MWFDVKMFFAWLWTRITCAWSGHGPTATLIEVWDRGNPWKSRAEYRCDRCGKVLAVR